MEASQRKPAGSADCGPLIIAPPPAPLLSWLRPKGKLRLTITLNSVVFHFFLLIMAAQGKLHELFYRYTIEGQTIGLCREHVFGFVPRENCWFRTQNLQQSMLKSQLSAIVDMKIDIQQMTLITSRQHDGTCVEQQQQGCLEGSKY